MKKRHYVLFIILLLLTSCNKSSPLEPAIAIDICWDTFTDRGGGGTITVHDLNDPIIIPELPEILVDTTTF
jgi:hypothetical protein